MNIVKQDRKILKGIERLNLIPEEHRGHFTWFENNPHVKCPSCGRVRKGSMKRFLKYIEEKSKVYMYCQPCRGDLLLESKLLTKKDLINQDAILLLDTQRKSEKDNRNIVIDRICNKCKDQQPVRISTVFKAIKDGRKLSDLCYGCLKPGESKRGKYKARKSPDHPFADVNGNVMIHRLVMEDDIGRYLLPSETVHHINGDTVDNRIENLQLRQGNHGSGIAFECQDCHSMNVLPVELK